MNNKIPKSIRFSSESLEQIEELIEQQEAKDRTQAIEVAVDRFHRQAIQGESPPQPPNRQTLAEAQRHLAQAFVATQGKILTMVEPAVKEQIIELDLSGQGLTDLPAEINQFPNLSRLDVSFNQLTRLPPEIGQLTQLDKLYLHDNQLTRLPPQIGKLTNLMRLHFYNNQLTRLPPEIGQLTNLLSLYLSRNQLTSLPLEVGRLTNLVWLDISHNQLTDLPSTLGQLTNLNRFYFNNNPFSIPSEVREQGMHEILTYIRGEGDEKFR